MNKLSARLKVEQSSVSQQLAVLRGRNFLNARKDGQNVFYSVRDREVFRLLDAARRIFNNQLIEVRDMLSQIDSSRNGAK